MPNRPDRPCETPAVTADGPLVSVVIPAFNHARYLDEAIQSVLGQQYSPLELIVLDDGSTDDTRAVLSRYNDRFHWESHANVGQAATLNKGWRLARGEILSYLSADDLLRPGCVGAAVTLLGAKQDVVLTYCDFQVIDENSRLLREVHAPEIAYEKMVTDLVCVPGPGAFFRREVFDKIGGWDETLRQMPDFDYWLRTGLRGRFERIPRLLAGFRFHGGSQTSMPVAVERADEPVRIIEKYFQDPNVPASVRARRGEATGGAHLLSAQLHLRARRYALAWHALRLAYACCPGKFLQPHTLHMLANGIFHPLLRRLLSPRRRKPMGGT